MTSEEARVALERAISDLCRDFNTHVFTPVLEIDVAAHLYHLLLTNGCSPNEVYLSTRVCGRYERTRKPDLVIGTRDAARACIRPVLICELKVFQSSGMSPQQMRRRFEGILYGDIPSLTETSTSADSCPVEIVADFHVSTMTQGYLTGNWGGRRRIDVIRNACRKSGTALIWLHTTGANSVVSEVVM